MVWIAGAVALQTPGARRAAQGGPALGDPAAAQHGPAAVAARSSTRWRASIPFPASTGPRPTSPPPTARHRARPRGRAAARESVVKVLGTACGLGVEGSGWVARAGPRGHERPRRRGPERHDGAAARPRAGLDARRRSRSTRATTSRCCASPGWTRRRCRWRRVRARGHVGGDPRLPAQRALRRPRRRGSAPTREVITQDAYGRGPVRRLDHVAARARALRQLRRADGGRRTGSVVATVFAAHDGPGPRGGYARARTRWSRAGARRRVAVPVVDRTLRAAERERYAPPHQWPRRSSSPRSPPSGAT